MSNIFLKISLTAISLWIIASIVDTDMNNLDGCEYHEWNVFLVVGDIADLGEEESEPVAIREDEYNLLLRVCMSECGGKYGEPLAGKIAVVETILNRCEITGKSITEVVYEDNQYSTADNGYPDETVKEAVDYALSVNTYPDNMIYFRTEHYHDFGVPYRQIGNHYFSLKED